MSDENYRSINWTIIPTGGEGTRLRPFTEERPKPLVPLINNFPIMEFVLYTLAYGAKLRHFVFGTRGIKHYQNVHSYYKGGSGWSGKLGIKPQAHLEYQNPNYLDTGNADSTSYIIKTFDIENPILVVPCDNIFYKHDILNLVKFGQNSDYDVVVALTSTEDARPYGLVSLDPKITDKIIEFKEKPVSKKPVPGIVNTAIYYIKPSAFSELKSDFGKNTLPKLVSEGRVGGYIMKKPWYDLGNPSEHLDSVMSLIKNPSPCFENFLIRLHTKIETPKSIVWVRGKSVISNTKSESILSRIKSGKIKTEGVVIIGKDSHIEDGVYLKNCSVGDITTIGAGSIIEDSNLLDVWNIRENVKITDSFLGRGGVVDSKTRIISSYLGDDIKIGTNCALDNVIGKNHARIPPNQKLRDVDGVSQNLII